MSDLPELARQCRRTAQWADACQQDVESPELTNPPATACRRSRLKTELTTLKHLIDKVEKDLG